MEEEVKNEIARFMGYEVVRIGYYGTDDETAWQVENTNWLNKREIREQYNDSIGDYYVNVKEDRIIPIEDVDWANNWNDLMAVVEKIDSLPETSFEMYPAYAGIGSRIGVGVQITTSRKDFKVLVLPNGRSRIEVVYKAVVEFIRWYNTTQKSI
jgi:hypothetical protein